MMIYYTARYDFQGLGIVLEGKYRGKQYIDNAEQYELESYNIFNGAVSYDFGPHIGFGSLRASLRVQNLLDKEYVQAGYTDWGDGLPRYMVGAERNLFLSLDVGI